MENYEKFHKILSYITTNMDLNKIWIRLENDVLTEHVEQGCDFLRRKIAEEMSGHKTGYKIMGVYESYEDALRGNFEKEMD